MKISKLQLFYLAALSMLGFVATDMYLPAFKTMEADFATGPEQIALSLTVFLSVWLLASFYGVWLLINLVTAIH